MNTPKITRTGFSDMILSRPDGDLKVIVTFPDDIESSDGGRTVICYNAETMALVDTTSEELDDMRNMYKWLHRDYMNTPFPYPIYVSTHRKARVLIVHTGFHHEAAEPAGRRIIDVTVPHRATPDEIAEAAFHAMNAPDGEYVEVRKEGRCYTLSVGDFIGVEDHDMFICVSAGWEPVTNQEYHSLIFAQTEALLRGDRFDMAFHGVHLLKDLRVDRQAMV